MNEIPDFGVKDLNRNCLEIRIVYGKPLPGSPIVCFNQLTFFNVKKDS